MKIARRFAPSQESIEQHQVPKWYEDAKLGIFIHWGLYSIPAFAPPTCALGDIPIDEGWFCNNPYSEWYLNSIRTKKGPSYEYHVNKYGEDFAYENFADQWRTDEYRPEEWAELFAKAGAQYVILTTKHHDGFCLWDSEYTDYNAVKLGPKRDIMQELTDAVRDKGLKMGAYYSGILDWRFTKEPILDNTELEKIYPITYKYADYAYNQAMELIDKFNPSILWNDIGWPEKGWDDLRFLFAHYYNKVEEGVVNDRWSTGWCDYTTKEYNHGEKSENKKWEMCRGIGYSFGYNQVEGEEHLIGEAELISLLINTVAHNGNLLLNIGPMADGTIPLAQQQRLLALGKWLEENGEAIYGTRPYKRREEKCEEGHTIYFTQKGDEFYILVDGLKQGKNHIQVKDIPCYSEITFLSKKTIRTRFKDNDLVINIECKEDKPFPIAIKVNNQFNITFK